MFQNSCREQRSRSWSIRISNFQSPHCREKITMFKIYNTLILPTLKAAHRNGLLDFVPQYWGDVIEYAVILKNLGNTAATGVQLVDLIPAHTLLVAGSVASTAGTILSG